MLYIIMYKWKNKTIINNGYEERITKQPSLLLHVLYIYYRNNNEDNPHHIMHCIH